jgi:hypothetical protein
VSVVVYDGRHSEPFAPILLVGCKESEVLFHPLVSALCESVRLGVEGCREVSGDA